MPSQKRLDNQSDWVPLHIARFRYAPDFLGPPEAWQKHFEKEFRFLLEEAFRGSDLRFVKAKLERSISVAFGELRFEVDGDLGLFLLELPGNPDNPDMPIGEPASFLSQARGLLKTRYGEEISVFIQLGDSLIDRMRARLDLALSSGRATIMARPQNLLNNFQPLAYDQWIQFSVDQPSRREEDDRSFDSATGVNGERIFSLHVAPLAARSPSGPKNRGRPPILGSIIKMHLVELIKQNGPLSQAKRNWRYQADIARSVQDRLIAENLDASDSAVRQQVRSFMEKQSGDLSK